DRLDGDSRVVTDVSAVLPDPLDQLARVVRSLLVLDPGVEILGRLAYDDEVDVLVTRADAAVALARAHLSKEIKGLAQRDVHRAEAAPDRRRYRPLERDAVAFDRLENVVGQRIPAVALHHVRAGFLDVPLQVHARRFEDALGRFRQLRPDAI